MNVNSASNTHFGDVYNPSQTLDSQLPGRSLSTKTSVSSRPVEALDGDDTRLPQQNTFGAKDSSQTNDAQPASTGDSSEKNAQASRAVDAQERAKLEQEKREINQLASRDREVRAHEQAHAAVGGQFAGAPSYQYERGPNGVSYAVGGEVPIDVGAAATPAETIRKMQIVQRAALAPAEPSPQDRRVAAQAARQLAQAQAELAAEQRESAEKPEKTQEAEPKSEAVEEKPSPTGISEPKEPRETSQAFNTISSNTSAQFSRFSQALSAIENAASGVPSGSLFNASA